jgi:hypothetical protein
MEGRVNRTARRERTRPLFLQVLLQERRRTLPGELGRRLVVAAALVAIEAVLRVGIDVDFAIAATLLLDRCRRRSSESKASFSPKCSCVGTFGFSSAFLAIWPP